MNVAAEKPLLATVALAGGIALEIRRDDEIPLPRHDAVLVVREVADGHIVGWFRKGGGVAPYLWRIRLDRVVEHIAGRWLF